MVVCCSTQHPSEQINAKPCSVPSALEEGGKIGIIEAGDDNTSSNLMFLHHHHHRRRRRHISFARRNPLNGSACVSICVQHFNITHDLT
jgi:hypothetical protein